MPSHRHAGFPISLRAGLIWHPVPLKKRLNFYFVWDLESARNLFLSPTTKASFLARDHRLSIMRQIHFLPVKQKLVRWQPGFVPDSWHSIKDDRQC